MCQRFGKAIAYVLSLFINFQGVGSVQKTSRPEYRLKRCLFTCYQAVWAGDFLAQGYGLDKELTSWLRYGKKSLG